MNNKTAQKFYLIRKSIRLFVSIFIILFVKQFYKINLETKQTLYLSSISNEVFFIKEMSDNSNILKSIKSEFTKNISVNNQYEIFINFIYHEIKYLLF